MRAPLECSKLLGINVDPLGQIINAEALAAPQTPEHQMKRVTQRPNVGIHRRHRDRHTLVQGLGNSVQHRQGVPRVVRIFQTADHGLRCSDQVSQFLLGKPGVFPQIVDQPRHLRVYPLELNGRLPLWIFFRISTVPDLVTLLVVSCCIGGAFVGASLSHHLFLPAEEDHGTTVVRPNEDIEF